MAIHDAFQSEPVTAGSQCDIPVAALHGSAASSRQWGRLAAHLGNDIRFIAPDLPAHAGCASLQARADMVAAQLQAYGRPVHLVGHSAGGAVAVKIALSRPDLVASLNLIEPVLFHLLGRSGGGDLALLQEVTALAATIKTSAASGNPALGMAQFVNFLNGRGYWTTLPADRRIRLAAQCGQVVDDFAAAFAEDWPLAAVGGLAMPVLLVMGLQSPPGSMRITEMLAETIGGARLIVVPYGGHMTPFTHPAIVNPAIARHIQLAEAGAALPLAGSAPAGGQRAA